MTAERLLLTLSVIAVGLILTAIAVTAGKAPQLPALVPFVSIPESARLSLPSKLSDGWTFAGGLLVGWLLHWIYGLPWSAIPRALMGLILSWRPTVLLLGVAVGCTAVLLLY